MRTSVTVAVGGIAVCLVASAPGPSNAVPALDASYAGSFPGGAPGLTYALNSGNPVLVQTFIAQASGRLSSYGIYVVPAASGKSGSLTVATTTTGAAGDLAGNNLLVQRQTSIATLTTPGLYDFDAGASGVDTAATGAPAPDPRQVLEPATTAVLSASLLGSTLFHRKKA